jgi:hypothetical protein
MTNVWTARIGNGRKSSGLCRALHQATTLTPFQNATFPAIWDAAEPSMASGCELKQAWELAQNVDAALHFGRPVCNGFIERKMSSQHLQ